MTSLRLARHSLRTRITLATLAIFVAGIWSLAYYSSQALRNDIERLLGEQQFSTVSVVAADIDQGISGRLRALEKLAGRISPAMMGNAAMLQFYLEDRPAFQSLFNAGTYVTGIDGTAIASLPDSVGRVGMNYMERDHVAAALSEGKAVVSKPVTGKMLHAPVVAMAAPIRDTRRKVIGALVGVIDLSQPSFLDKIARNAYGKAGGYLLVAPQHHLFVTATDKSRIMQPLPAHGMNPMHDRYMKGYEGYGIATSSRGVEELTAAKGIPGAGWFLVAVLPTDEAYAPIQSMQQRMLLAASLLTLLAGVFTWWMVRHQLAPVLVAARTLAAQSRSGRAMQPLPITSQDEIGQLIGGFNALLKTLGQREVALKESSAIVAQQARRAQALLELPEMSELLDEQAFMQRGQELAEDLTGSTISFIHFVAEDKETIELVTWSRRTLEHYCHAAFDQHYPLSHAGIWADALRQRQPVVFNNYPGYAHKHGLPEGHAELNRLISVPVIENGKVVMLTGVGNKSTDYSEMDVETVLLISSEIWRIVQRKRLENNLQLHRQNLEHLVGERTSDLAVAKQFAEASNSAKSRFLAAASHDLRQPLSALSLYVDALSRKGSAEELDLVMSIQSCVDSLSKLLTDILDVSKLDAGVVTPAMSSFTIDALLGEVISVYSVEARLKGIQLRWRDSGLVAGTDRLLLSRILNNLVANAVCYTDRGAVLVACRRHQGKHWVEVWDTGRGIPEGDTKLIFDEFIQLGDGARTRGSGLGLSIVAKAAGLLGLEIRLRSRLGKGSMFAIEIPSGGPIVADPFIPPPSGDQELLRIAVVDDNPEVLKALRLALERNGHDVVAGSTGHALLEGLAEKAPDIVIADFRLQGGETGFSVIEAVRRRFGDELPAIVITGDTDPSLIRSLSDRGITVQFKPVQTEMLLGFIREATARKAGGG